MLTKTEIAARIGLDVPQLDNVIVELARDKRLRGDFDTAINRSYTANRLVDDTLEPPAPERYENVEKDQKGNMIKGEAVYGDDVVIINDDQV